MLINYNALNVDKTNFVIFHAHAKNLTEPTALKFGHKKITQADHVRFLWVLLDETVLVGSLTLLNCPGNLPGQLEFSTNSGIMFH